ncbi:MAG: AmmeMemoRadiSam system radical SAM enzyme [Candidatus Nanoarchaeia archaeon]
MKSESAGKQKETKTEGQNYNKKKERYCYEKLTDNKVRCHACAHNCLILPGKLGICEVRENIEGTLFSKVYDKIIALHIDPVEKKPLYHFYPGSKALSLGTVGCNFNCVFCQNYDISFPGEKTAISGEEISPEELVDIAADNNCKSIAYTYTEPVIFLELVADTSRLAKAKGIKNILVTNGYLSMESIELLSESIDAVNIDLKSFSEDFYIRNCKAKLAPVLEAIKEFQRRKIWIELTTLVIEGENNSDAELRKIAKFIAGIDKEIPWHISRFFPMHKMKNIPPTSLNSLNRAYEIGKQEGLVHVYIGNTGCEQNTECSKCGNILIRRNIYESKIENLNKGSCTGCGKKLKGVF